jgi:hypothetical protein
MELSHSTINKEIYNTLSGVFSEVSPILGPRVYIHNWDFWQLIADVNWPKNHSRMHVLSNMNHRNIFTERFVKVLAGKSSALHITYDISEDIAAGIVSMGGEVYERMCKRFDPKLVTLARNIPSFLAYCTHGTIQ